MVRYKAFWDDGEWHAGTLGHFIGLLIDSGIDRAVTYKVIEDGQVGNDGQFIRHLEIVMLPNGCVKDQLNKMQCHSVHKTLMALLESGVVK